MKPDRPRASWRLVLLGAIAPVALAGCRSTAVVAEAESAPGPPGAFAPKRYRCPRAAGEITVDGRLEEAAWSRAPWSDPFIDIQGPSQPAPRYETHMKMVWDDAYLYIAARLEEPHVWGTLTEHDEIVFRDNDFEVFIDPDGDRREYYEVEVNALNTIFDLLLERTYIDGGPARHEWDVRGLRTAVHVDGTLNDPADVDRGWSVEIALPWRALAERAHVPAPPRPGDTWRINFSRVQWRHEIVDGAYRKIEGIPEDNWVWTPQGVIDMHRPETWGYVEFTEDH